VVNVRDRNSVDHIAIRLLIANDHFGEIALLHRTRRSVSVICRNYNTMAKLSLNHFREIISSFPKFKKAITMHAYKYVDVNIEFKMKCLKKLTYLVGLPTSSFHHFMHMLEKQTFQRDQLILRAYDAADTMIILYSGSCEVVTYCEGNKFVIDHLEAGSIINQNAFLIEDIQYVDIQCSTSVTILKLTKERFK